MIQTDRNVTASLVVYKTPAGELEPLLAALRDEPVLQRWVLCDNAAEENGAASAQLRQLTERMGGLYLPSSNRGFGGGHNYAMDALRDTHSAFHLMVNPDITFAPDVLAELRQVMVDRPGVGMIMPRVLYEDGRDQYLAKLLPTPLDFALRRFAPGWLQALAAGRMRRYELRDLAGRESTAVPFLSGCFMFVRRSTFEAVGGFDERYFLYLEDVDLCRRFAAVSQLLYYPSRSVTHGYHRGAHRTNRLMLVFLTSAVRYFNRWGWLFDAGRKRANRAALACLVREQI